MQSQVSDAPRSTRLIEKASRLTSRSLFVLAMSILLAVAGSTATADPGSKTVTIQTYPGDAGMIAGFYEPWQRESGARIDFNPAGDWTIAPIDMLRSIRGTGKLTPDIVTLSLTEAQKACQEGLLQPADPTYQTMKWGQLPGISQQEWSQISPCAAAPILSANVVAFKSKPWEIGPQSVADFFDTQKFPGKRGLPRSPHGVLEWSLLADGVPPREVYSTLQTFEGQDRAFESLHRIADEVVWFDKPSQALALLEAGQITMTLATHHDVIKYRIRENGLVRIMWDRQLQSYPVFVAPKGAKEIGLADSFVKYVAASGNLSDWAMKLSGEPSTPMSREWLTAIAQSKTPTNPENSETALLMNPAFWSSSYGDILKTRFQYEAFNRGTNIENMQKPTATIPKKKPTETHAYWNSWLQNQKSRPERLASLQADVVKVYTFILDLSPFKYSDFDVHNAGSIPVDPTLRKEIQRLIDDDESTIYLRIRPILIGTGLNLLSSENEVNKVHSFDLERLKDPKPPDGNDLKALSSNEISLEDFSRKVHAGIVRVNIQATQPGCKAIALSVWNGSGDRPLDHLVYEFAVSRSGEEPPDCGIGDNPLRGGLDTLLASMISGDANRRIEADAGLHIFELKSFGVTNSHTVYMQREKSRPGKQQPDAGSANSPLFVRSWTLPEPLSHFLVSAGKLESDIIRARDKAQSSVPETGKPVWAYDSVAKSLAKTIFASPTPGDANPGEALMALDDLTKASKRRSLLMTRLVSAENRTLFLPLGLLSARGIDPVLSQPVTVVQQMANQRVTRGKPCIGSWAFAIPNRLDGIPDALDLPKIASNTSWFMGWLSDKGTLAQYIDGTLPGASRPGGEGLILLAHHGEGNIWFEAGDKLGLDAVKRSFPSGSVAMLSACRVGDFRGNNAAIIDVFNKMGIEAAIISPFQIDARYGAELAAQFAKVVHQRMGILRSATAKSEGAKNTLVDLFHTAVEAASTSMTQPVSEMGLEFLIIGNHMLELCED